MSEALSVIERSEWVECRAIVKRGLSTFYEVGQALLRIREKRLYREEYFTWEDYCREECDLSARRANQLIETSATVENVGKIFPKISTESHAQALSGLEPERQREAWQTVLETAPEGKITAAHIRTVVDRLNDVEKETVKAVSKEITARRAEENAAAREAIKSRPVVIPTGKFQCIVIDPPWPMEKIERDERHRQVGFDYPAMSEEELKAWPYIHTKAADDCHLYLWTTHKFLPMALRIVEHWGFKYQCLMTWVKNVGMTPFSWMYSTEHVLFCRRGNLPLEKLGLRLDFNAKVREHSRKPEEFYELVRQVSPGPRIDVFSRETHEGFEQLGNEVEKFQGVAA